MIEDLEKYYKRLITFEKIRNMDYKEMDYKEYKEKILDIFLTVMKK